MVAFDGETMSESEHWQRVYRTRKPVELSWHAGHLDRSLAAIEAVADPTSRIIDIGGGASTLADDLLARGFSDVTVLDISATALERAKERLGGEAARVRWIVADVTRAVLQKDAYDVWHDRAVFHFLVSAQERAAYAALAARCIREGGHLIIATFAPDGPARCSGLDVMRHDAQSLGTALGEAFMLTSEVHALHRTPSGVDQAFVHCVFERVLDRG